MFDGPPEAAVEHRRILANSSVRHTFVCTGSRRGVSAARNLGLSLVSAEYVVFLDDDDEFTKGAVSFARTQLADQGIPAVIYGNLQLMSVDGQVWGSDRARRATRLNTPNAYWTALSQGLSQLGATYIRAEYLRQVGGFDEALHTWNDRDLQYRLILGDGCIVFTDYELMRWRCGQDDSLSVLAQKELERVKSEYPNGSKGWPKLACDPIFLRYASRIPEFLYRKGAIFTVQGKGSSRIKLQVPLEPDGWNDSQQELVTEWLYRGLLEVV